MSGQKDIDDETLSEVRQEAIKYAQKPTHSYYVKAKRLDLDYENTIIGRAMKQTEADIWSSDGGNMVFDVRPILDEIEE